MPPPSPALLAAARAATQDVQAADALGQALVALGQEAGLDHEELGALIGAALADRGVELADEVIWTRVAILELILLDDFYSICHAYSLADLCCGFLEGRMLATDDPARATAEAEAFGIAWTIRLTGSPLLYDYVTMEEIEDFARSVVRTILDCSRTDTVESWGATRAALLDRFSTRVNRGVWVRLSPERLLHEEEEEEAEEGAEAETTKRDEGA